MRVGALGRELRAPAPTSLIASSGRPSCDVEAGGLDERVDADRRRRCRDVGLAQQDLDEALVVVGLAIDALERGERAAILGLAVEDLLVVLARELEIAADGAREVGDVEVQAALDLGVEHVGRDLAIRVDQIRFAAELAGEPLGLGDDLRRARARSRRGAAPAAARRTRRPCRRAAARAAARPRASARSFVAGIVGPLGLAQRELREPLVLRGRGVDGAQDVGGGDAQIGIVERGLDGGERLGCCGSACSTNAQRSSASIGRASGP